MSDNTALLMVLFFCLCDNPSCYRIEPGTMAGIIIADVILTIAIVIVTYHCASRRRRRKERADKVYMNVRANCKT
ncbi:hematopoietic cell signal transducer isoform X2 [Salvelinus namaycush]|uniref:Hematopoietic cell signal transducer n=1 Tax=Salvelinus namaycush TaxID=8040 RepID=A0A8U0PW13_SALNM|nr:hematopoietic cell signal transducer isoform X2 [Salvelinus namaycush]